MMTIFKIKKTITTKTHITQILSQHSKYLPQCIVFMKKVSSTMMTKVFRIIALDDESFNDLFC